MVEAVSRPRRPCFAPTLAAFVALTLVAGSCSAEVDLRQETAVSTISGSAGASTDLPPRAGYDPSIVSTPSDCLSGELLLTPEFDFSVAHRVVDGVLSATCLGDEDQRLIDAWNILSDLTPPGQLRDIVTFAGYTARDESDLVTLAFVQADEIDPSLFAMAVNLDASTDSRDELILTMAHEFAHVFTASPSELDRAADPADCETYDNAEGCYTPESIMAGWYEKFWSDSDYVATGDASRDEADGIERCALSPGFFGEYAASNPEEDFAESFSAYVLSVEPVSPEQRSKLIWIDRFEGLREFKDRALRFGYEPIDYGFGLCGGG